MKYLYSWMFVDVVYRHNCRILNVALLEPPGPGVRGSKHMVPRSRQELNITQSGHPHYASEDFGRQDHFIIRTFTGTGGSQYCSAKMHESRGGQRTLATTGSPAGGLVMPFFHHFSCRKWWISWWKLMCFFWWYITHYSLPSLNTSGGHMISPWYSGHRLSCCTTWTWKPWRTERL